MLGEEDGLEESVFLDRWDKVFLDLGTDLWSVSTNAVRDDDVGKEGSGVGLDVIRV